jgi:hypothetical protein
MAKCFSARAAVFEIASMLAGEVGVCVDGYWGNRVWDGPARFLGYATIIS